MAPETAAPIHLLIIFVSLCYVICVSQTGELALELEGLCRVGIASVETVGDISGSGGSYSLAAVTLLESRAAAASGGRLCLWLWYSHCGKACGNSTCRATACMQLHVTIAYIVSWLDRKTCRNTFSARVRMLVS